MEMQSFLTSVESEVKVLEKKNNQVAVSHLFVAARLFQVAWCLC